MAEIQVDIDQNEDDRDVSTSALELTPKQRDGFPLNTNRIMTRYEMGFVTLMWRITSIEVNVKRPWSNTVPITEKESAAAFSDGIENYSRE